MAAAVTARPIRVGLLGWGTIARSVAEQLDRACDAGDESLTLTAVASRFSGDSPHELAVPAEELGRHCDVVVEAAGPDALREHGRACLDAGADLLVVSIGALMDQDLRHLLASTGPGQVYLCAGAIGGLDLLTAARDYGPIERVLLRTTKPSATLVRDWMGEELRQSLTDPSLGPIECFRGPVAEAVERFPDSLNVSAALSLAVGDDSLVDVVVVGSPTTTSNTHDITVECAAGHYRFSIANTPSPDNPRTSHITPWAVVRSLRNLADTERMAFR